MTAVNDARTPDLSWLDDVTMSDLERNPYATYERLRAEAPLAYVPVLGSYVASTEEVCREVATSAAFEAVITPAGGRTFGHPAIIGVNGDVHADLRGMVEPALQPVEVAGCGCVVRQDAGQHLIHGDADGVDVAREDRLPVELFGCHVWRAADHRRPVCGDLKEA